jgi:hypothetical protein
MVRPTLTLAIVALGLAGLADAEEGYRHGRVRDVEPGVSIQRATEPGAEEAVANMPFLPGDRVWSDASGRAEFQFADGAVLRVDRGSKLDYVAHDEGGDERVVLRLWSGSLTLHPRAGRQSPEFAVETPGGVMVTQGRGVFRVDVDSGETRVSAYEGEAVLEADRRIRLRAGERVYARGGEAYGDPEVFDRAEADDFARWDAEREGFAVQTTEAVPEYLPEAVTPYAADLQDHGAWHFQAGLGHVWRPYVDVAWRPYHNGRWIWTAYGWTWLPYERWGWAPFHYGRWDFAPTLGWYWLPGRTWSPAWVDWAVGSDYVGWCPLGWRDRPTTGLAGWPLPRGTAHNAWIYARRGDLGARDLARRVALDTARPRNMVVLDSRARVTRDVGVAFAASSGDRAVPRGDRTSPAPLQAAPALQGDAASATLPFPAARRRTDDGRERDVVPREASRRGRPLPGDTAAAETATERPEAPAAAAPPAPTPDPARPFPWTARPRPGRGGEHAGERASEQLDTHSPQADREVMRPVFGTLGRPRSDGERNRGDRPAPADRPVPSDRSLPPDRALRPERSAPRPEREQPTPRAAPQPTPQAPPPGAASAAPAGGGDRAVRRKRDN